MKINCPYPDCEQPISIEIADADSQANCPGCGRPFQCPPLSAFSVAPTAPRTGQKPAASVGADTKAQSRKVLTRDNGFVIETHPPLPVIPLLSIVALCTLVIVSFPLVSAASLFSLAGAFMALASLGGSKVPVHPYSAFSHAQKIQQALLGTFAKVGRIVAGGFVSVVMLGLVPAKEGAISETSLPLATLAAASPLGIWFFVSLVLVGRQVSKSPPTCTNCGTVFQTRDDMTALIKAKRCPVCR